MTDEKKPVLATQPPPFGGAPNCVRVQAEVVGINGESRPVTLMFPVSHWERVVRGNTRYYYGEIMTDGDPARFAFEEPVT